MRFGRRAPQEEEAMKLGKIMRSLPGRGSRWSESGPWRMSTLSTSPRNKVTVFHFVMPAEAVIQGFLPDSGSSPG
jgi:hypothetical protein